MPLIDELKEQREEARASLEMQQEFVAAHQSNVAEWYAKLADLDTAIAALEAPAQPLPSVEGVTVTPATEENSGGPIIDAQTCEPIDPHVSWEPPPPTEVEPDLLVDAGGYAPVTDGDYVEHISVLTGDPAVEPEINLYDFVEKALTGEFPDITLTPFGEGWKLGWVGADVPSDLAMLEGYEEGAKDRARASVLDDPELQAAVDRAEAKLDDEKQKARALVDAELDAELDRVREQERARAKHHFSIFGKLEDA